jgi:hypothetical protein
MTVVPANSAGHYIHRRQTVPVAMFGALLALTGIAVGSLIG